MTESHDDGPRRPPSVRDSLGTEAQKPTPVREAMDATRDEPEPVELPSVHLSRDDEEWIVRVEGRTHAGVPGDSGAPLLLLTFARAETPHERVLETLHVGRRLDRLSERQLLAALAGAHPYDGDWEPGDLFPGTRKGRKGGS